MRAALFVLMLVALHWPSGAFAAATPAVDVYALVVGISRYADPAGEDVESPGSLPGVNVGAAHIAEMLVSRGARHAVLLRSRDEAYVTPEDVYSALASLKQRIVRDKAARPFLLVYVGGHGIGEGAGWNHFTLPGDLTFRVSHRPPDLERLAARTVHAADLVERLNATRMRYLLLLDSCYEGDERSFLGGILNPKASRGLEGVLLALRHFNQFRQPSPVLFSAMPGTRVKTVPDPISVSTDPDNIGPLARRFLLLGRQSERRPVSLRQTVRALTARDFDPETGPAVSHAVADSSWSATILSSGGRGGRLEELEGSARSASEPCCSAAAEAAPRQSSLAGVIRLTGAAGEHVSAGERLVFDRPVSAQVRNGEIALRWSHGQEDWSLDLVVPRGTPSPGRFEKAARASFQADGEAGFSVSGAGRGCSRSSSSFTIESVAVENGLLKQLRLTARQYCDGVPAPLDIFVDVRAPR